MCTTNLVAQENMQPENGNQQVVVPSRNCDPNMYAVQKVSWYNAGQTSACAPLTPTGF